MHILTQRARLSGSVLADFCVCFCDAADSELIRSDGTALGTPPLAAYEAMSRKAFWESGSIIIRDISK